MSDKLDALLGAAGDRVLEITKQLTTLRERQKEIESRIRALTNEQSLLEALLAAHGLARAEGPQEGREPNGTGNSPQVPESVPDLVVDLLQSKGPLHYRQIEAELRQSAKFIAGGKDAANTLLAKFFDDPRLYRPARGVYAVKANRTAQKNVPGRRRKAR